MLKVDELLAIFIDAQENELPDVDVHEDLLREELSLIAAETGMDRELCYCPERHMEDSIEIFIKNPVDNPHMVSLR